jgi:hypothetical protein
MERTTTVRITKKLADALKAEARKNGMFMHHILKLAVESYLAARSKESA